MRLKKYNYLLLPVLLILKNYLRMRFLFQSSIAVGRKKFEYRVYQFKLTPERYKAEPTGAVKKADEIFFWKLRNRWKAERRECQKLVEVIGKRIASLEG